jgi:hypothetical protein
MMGQAEAWNGPNISLFRGPDGCKSKPAPDPTLHGGVGEIRGCKIVPVPVGSKTHG